MIIIINRIYIPGHNILAIYCVSVQLCFAASKTGFDI